MGIIFLIITVKGLQTGRDSWCINSNFEKLKKNIQSSLDFYNNDLKNPEPTIDLQNISWTQGIKDSFKIKKELLTTKKEFIKIYIDHIIAQILLTLIMLITKDVINYPKYTLILKVKIYLSV